MFGYTVFKLTDNATDLSFLSGGPYSLIPDDMPDLGVATLRQSTLGGNAPYTDVECSIPVNITGACPSDVYAAYIALWQMLDRAQRWWKGDGVSPIYLIAQATGSTQSVLQPSGRPITTVESMVLRRADADTPLVMPPVYEVTAGNYTMQGVVLRFWRTGAWLGGQETSSSATAQQFANTLSVAFFNTAGTLPNPTYAAFTPTVAPFAWTTTLVAFANATANIAFVDAWTTGVSTADTSARGGAYYKFAALAAGSTTTILNSTSLATFDARRATLILSCRTPTSGIWQVQATITRSGPSVTTVLKTLDAGVTTPRLLIFEDVNVESAPGIGISVTLSVINRTLAASDFDIDFLCLVATQSSFISTSQNIEPTSYIISVQAMGSTGDYLTIDPMVMDRKSGTTVAAGERDRPYPLVCGTLGLVPNTFASWSGDAFLTTQGNAPVACLLAVSGTSWRPMSGGSPVTTDMIFYRRRSFLVLP